MQQAPPQFSPDGLYWWDGARWVARAANAPAPMPPVYSSTPSYLKPSPGLRIVLLVALSLEVGLAGFLGFVFIASTIGGAQEDVALSYTLGFAFAGLFGLSVAAIVGVSMRTVWSRWVAIACGILICFSVVGLLIGIPILVTAARAPDLSPPPGR